MGADADALKKQMKEEFIERLLTRFLDIIIMGRFQNEPFSNYDATDFVQKEFGFKVSSGTIHSTIYAMERKNLVAGITMNGKKVYRITDRGKLTVEVASSPEEMVGFMKRVFGRRGEDQAAKMKASFKKQPSERKDSERKDIRKI